MSVNVGSAEGHLDLDISQFIAKLETAAGAANAMANKTTQTVNQKLAGMGQGFVSAGKTLTKAVTLPVVALGGAAVGVTAKFDSAMSKVSAVSGATGTDLERLRAKAKEMGATTKFSATESAEAFNYMAMAGWKTNDMIDGISGIMNLAAASGEDLATTSDIVTDALTAFGLQAKDSGHFADVLAAASSNANTNVAMLGESFKYVAPVAGALGYSVEDTNIALGLMANAGIKASQAGTSLRSIMTNLSTNANGAADTFKELGIEVTNADGSMRPFKDVMADARVAFKNLNAEQQTSIAKTVAGKNAMSGLLAIVNSSDKDFEKLTDAIYNADGAADKMAKTMLDNLGGQLTLLKSALEGLAISFGEALMPMISGLVKVIQGFVDKLNSMSDGTRNAIIRIALLAASIGPLLTVFGKLLIFVGNFPTRLAKLTASFGMLKTNLLALPQVLKTNMTALTSFGKTLGTQVSTGIKGIGTAIGGISAPALIVAGVIAGLVAVFVTLWKTNEDFRNKVTAIWNGIKKSFQVFGQSIVDTLNQAGFKFDNFKQVISTVTNAIKKIWINFCNLFAPIFEKAFATLGIIIQGVLQLISGLFKTIVGIIKGDGDMIKSGVERIWKGIWKVISAVPKLILSLLTSLMTIVANFAINLARKGLEAGRNFLTNVVNFIKQLPNQLAYWFGFAIGKAALFVIEMVKKAIEAGSKFITNVINFIKQLPSRVWTWLQQVIAKGQQFATQFPQKAKTAAKNFFNNLINGIKNLPSRVKAIANSIVNGLSSFVSGMASKAQQAASSFFNGIVNGLSGLPGRLSGIGADIARGLWNGISGLKDWVIGKVRSMGSSIISGLKAALGISSPSKVAEKEVGAWIPPGIVVGFEKAMPKAEAAMQDALNDVDLEMKPIEQDDPLGGFVDKFKEVLNQLAEFFDSFEQRFSDNIQSMMLMMTELSKATNVMALPGGGYIGYNGFGQQQTAGFKRMEDQQDYRPRNGGGDTFIFNSPKPIDEVEAARQLKKTKQDLAEGF